MNSILTFLGFYTDNSFPHVDGFWATPCGLVVSASMCICATINVIHPDIEDDLFDRIWYSLLAVLMLIAFLIGLSPENDPHHVVKTLLMLLFVKLWYQTIQKLFQNKPTKTT